MRILKAFDGSSNGEEVLRLGTQAARRAAEPPTVLTVIKHTADRPPAPADAILGRARELLQAAVPFVRARVRIGFPAEEIVREAREGGYDRVIMGQRRHRNRLFRFLQGSTSVRVVRQAPCPVVVAKGEARSFRRILLCDSGAESVSAWLCEATDLSVRKRFTAQLTDLLTGEEETSVLHVMSIHPHPKVSARFAVGQILVKAQKGDIDLVVIGANRGEGWQNKVLDDAVHKIVVQLD
jgi:nucleotide-binding universal stress UspA family protein